MILTRPSRDTNVNLTLSRQHSDVGNSANKSFLKGTVLQPSRLILNMTIFYLTIPLMILGVAIAIVPLVWAMKHHEEWETSAAPTVLFEDSHDELLAA